ncbi:glycoside hydrolase family 5 protein [Botryobasidium botryosum FD-172 SS1]|uniref:glucan 1,3-beta-glucosidase n=1 Tax=Botryobasidium botryosum (strain FD-172 SS1) TaxID=930990 RepID=A0A067N1X5_BOTB1|nr:glycoside hydrolase family 5 protein [Botryobasidium botryosum FD-172 SS1]
MDSEKYSPASPPPARSRTKRFALIGAAAVVVLVLVIALPVALTRKHSENRAAEAAHGSSSGSGGAGGSPGAGAGPTSGTTGGDGSKITTEDGRTFTYHNSFGGRWVYDANNPFDDSARPQSWTPALNETFHYGTDIIRGVNLGGWLTLEPFITPALFQKYLKSPNDTSVVDEWTLSQAMTADGTLQTTLENHYKTFITEEDFAQIAGAGLNYVRISLPFWAIEVRDDEPFLPHTSWTYFLKAITWARKYGIRINLDLHALPGSQNGYNHGGKLGIVNFMNGPMGFANAQRSLDYIRIITEFISQPQYKNVVPMFGIANEVLIPTIGQSNVNAFYYQAHQIIRAATGVGEGNGPWISIHDGFFGPALWADYMPGADRVALDTHPYFAFQDQPLAPPFAGLVNRPCTDFADRINGSLSAFGMTYAGEYSNGWNDCGTFLNGIGMGTRFEGTFPGTSTAIGNCLDWTNWAAWTDDTKASIKKFALSSMDALSHSFFWTWKIANSTAGTVESPLWSYQLGLQHGWMPTDPREAVGYCGNTHPFAGPISPPSRTGGVGAGTIDPTWVASYSVWPPAISSAPTLAAYAPTGPVPTLPVPTFTKPGDAKATIAAGSGWTNTGDTALMNVGVSGCQYPSAWAATPVVPPCAAVGTVLGAAAVPPAAPVPVPTTNTATRTRTTVAGAVPTTTTATETTTTDALLRPRITSAPRL